MEPAKRALAAIQATGIPFSVTTHGPVASLEEAAAARGLTPDRVLKSIVVRRAADDYLFVLIPGGRSISYPKLRNVLGVNRLTMPSAEEALDVTGYERGAITPFGSLASLPVVMDTEIPDGQVSIGGGAHGTAFTVDAHDLAVALGALRTEVGK